MAFTSNDVEIVEIKKVFDKEVNEYRIYGMNIRIDPNDPAGLIIVVDYGKGYIDDDEKFVAVKRDKETLSGPSILSAVTAPVTDGSTRYDEIKNGIWSALLSEGLVPEGTVS